MEIPKIGNMTLLDTTNEVRAKTDAEDFEKRLKKAMDQKDDAELRKTCSEFETLILNILYKQMKSTIQKSQLLPEDAGRSIYESMLDDKLVEEAAKNGGFGIGDMLYKQLKKDLKSAYKLE